MADIGDFAEEVGRFYGICQKAIPRASTMKPMLLSPETVVNFVKDVYYASLIPDEGRWPSCALVCYPPEVALQFHLLFAEPLDVTPSKIAKLSHAIDNRSHIACTVSEGAVKLAG